MQNQALPKATLALLTSPGYTKPVPKRVAF